ncbi:hypothetical protein HG531_010500 [Fusarium graminearum]|nr:hypothetical protein HG531_010500 [Fusarium graminearum]
MNKFLSLLPALATTSVLGGSTLATILAPEVLGLTLFASLLLLFVLGQLLLEGSTVLVLCSTTLCSGVVANGEQLLHKSTCLLLLRARSHDNSALLHGTLDLTTNTRNCLDGSAFELGNLKRCVKHVLDESGVLVDLGRCTSELELLDNLGGFVDAQDCASSSNTEARHRTRHGVEADETCVWRNQRTVDGSEAVHVLGCVLEHAVTRPRVGSAVNGHGLETTPAKREDKGVVRLQDTLVPSVTLDANLEITEAVFSSRETTNNDGTASIEELDELGGNALKDDLCVFAGAVAFDDRALSLVKVLKLLLVDVELFLNHGLLRFVPIILAKLLDVTTISSGVGLVVQETLTIFLFESHLKFLLSLGVLLSLGLDVFGHWFAVQVVLPSQCCCFLVGIIFLIIFHLLIPRHRTKIGITVSKSKIVLVKVLVSILAEHLAQNCFDLLAALEKLHTTLHLTEKLSLSLKTNDHLFSLAPVSLVLFSVETETFVAGNPDSVTIDLQAATI